MDNITHSLVGIAAGQWASNSVKAPKSKTHQLAQRRLLIWSSVIANNFPDLDILYTRITPGPLGSLLHHRGHTHTLIGLLPQWLILVLIFFLVRKKFGFEELERRDWYAGGAISILGLFLHILADSFNSYGVHPFFPAWNGWIYGDAIFIIEPAIWAIFAASNLSAGKNILRYLPAVFLVGLLFFGWREDFINLTSTVTVLVLFAGLFAIFRTNQKSAPRTAVVLVCLFVLMNFSLGRVVRKDFFGQTGQQRLLDVILSPVPANPLCWFVITASIDGDKYVVKRGIASVSNRLIDVRSCPDLGRLEGGGENVFETVGSIEVRWSENHSTSLESFQILEKNCGLRAWMRFARVPFIQDEEATDLRFSRKRLANFTNVESRSGECPPFVPPWIPPRWDLIVSIGAASWF